MGNFECVLLGGRPADWVIFGGLALYAICGCAAQDLRVSKQEGTVGTVFRPGEDLQDFFKTTSLVPFGAVVAGKQNLVDIFKEVPWAAFLIGLPIAYQIEVATLNFLR